MYNNNNNRNLYSLMTVVFKSTVEKLSINIFIYLFINSNGQSPVKVLNQNIIVK